MARTVNEELEHITKEDDENERNKKLEKLYKAVRLYPHSSAPREAS